MADPLSDLIALLRPRTVFAKAISGAGRWAVRYGDFGHPGFCTVIEGRCRLSVDGADPATVEAGDFVFLPATPGFTMGGFEPAEPVFIDPHAAAGLTGEVRHGRQEGEPDVKMLGGYFVFESPDAALLVSQLPALIHLRGAERLATLVRLVREEAGAERPGCDLVLSRLVEVLIVEALRSVDGDDAPPGLLRGLGDPRLAAAIRQIDHGLRARSSAFRREHAGRTAAVRSMPSRSHEKRCAGLRHRVGLGVPTRVRRTMSRSSVFPACGAGRRRPVWSRRNLEKVSTGALRCSHDTS